MSKQPTPAEIVAAMENLGLIAGATAKHAADIAHARRVLYEAYLAEGFSEVQALDLCKVLFLS